MFEARLSEADVLKKVRGTMGPGSAAVTAIVAEDSAERKFEI